MRKAGSITVDTPQEEVVTLTQGAEVFLPFVSYDYADFLEKKGREEENIGRAREAIQSNIKQYMQSYNALKNNIVPPALYESDTIKANTIYRNIKQHAFIDSVKFLSHNNFVIYTKLLFADIRTEDGSRETKRRCIGAYKINVYLNNYSGGSVRVHNLLYSKSVYTHYAIKENVPCFGNYATDINMRFSDKDVYGIADIMINFLRFAEDGSAWRPAHHWIKMRVNSMPQITTGRVREGASLVMLHDDGEFREGSKHKVVRSYNGKPILKKEDGGEYAIWNKEDYTIIKNTLYKKIDSLQDIETMYFDKLDALPDGSTLIEAQEILNNI